MIKVKKRRLKTHWLVIFTVLITLSTQFVIKVMSDRLNQIAETCDKKYGYTCSYYQMRQN